jgi:hypothetical protein
MYSCNALSTPVASTHACKGEIPGSNANKLKAVVLVTRATVTLEIDPLKLLPLPRVLQAASVRLLVTLALPGCINSAVECFLGLATIS